MAKSSYMNHTTGREFERKYLVNGDTSKIEETLSILFPKPEIVSGIDHDTYWASPTTDFVRLRRLAGGSGAEITTKLTDKGTNQDRAEISVKTSDYDAAFQYLRLLHGLPLGEVAKSFKKFEYATGEISIYRVIGDSRLFLEIEGKSQDIVDVVSKQLEKAISTLQPEPKSIFQLFIKKESK